MNFGKFSFVPPASDQDVQAKVSATGGTPASAEALEASKAADLNIQQRPRRTRKTSESSGPDQRALQEQVAASIREQLDAIHDPKAWAALLGLPAAAAQAITGHERWKISEEERATLGACGSAASRTMMVTNPRMLAFFMLGSALITVYTPRAIQQLEEMIQKKRDAAKTKVVTT